MLKLKINKTTILPVLYGYETCSVTSREELKLQSSYKKYLDLRRIK
jgi:hypothetical protein